MNTAARQVGHAAAAAAAAARTYGTVVTLMGAGTDAQGAVHCHQYPHTVDGVFTGR